MEATGPCLTRSDHSPEEKMRRNDRLLSTRRLLGSFVVVLLLSAIPRLTNADPLKLTADALTAGSEIKNAYGDLSAAIAAVNRILQNQIPSADPEWSKIADEYDQAAKDANNASLHQILFLA